MKLLILIFLVFFQISWKLQAEETYYVITCDVDPPIFVDGKLDDWDNVPNSIYLNKRKNVTFGAKSWSGLKDLSGIIRLAWRPEGIFIAAEVTDDKLCQPFQGRSLWKGDHVNIWMDMTPGVEPGRGAFGKGQCHIGLSPGNFLDENDPNMTPPEIFVFKPDKITLKTHNIVSRKTGEGYIIEAFIPFSELKIKEPAVGEDVNFEVSISDTDDISLKQETMITYGTAPWLYSRHRLVPLVYGDGNGKAPAPVRNIRIFKNKLLAENSSADVKFNCDSIPEGKVPYLFFKGRIKFHRVAGYKTGVLSVKLNGKILGGRQLVNRPPKGFMFDGRTIAAIRNDNSLTLPFTPSYSAINKDTCYGLIDNIKPGDFEFDAGGILKPGENVLTFSNLAKEKCSIALDDCGLLIKRKTEKKQEEKTAPPTGKIPTYEPEKAISQTYSSLKENNNKIYLKVNDKLLTVSSRFSTPDGKWQTGSNSYYKFHRTVIPHQEWIEICDSFKNLTGNDVPVIQEYSCALPEKAEGIWLGGLRIYSDSGSRMEPQNPSVFASTGTLGIGLMPLNDEFQVHVSQTFKKNSLILKDGNFYLKPNAEYSARWAVIPVDKPDYWKFVNAARRIRDVNYPLELCYAFMFHEDPIYEWSDAAFKNFISKKGANFIVKSFYGVRDKKGRPTRGTAWINGPHTRYTDLIKRVHKHFPKEKVKTGIYMHPFIDSSPENNIRFKDDRALDSSGNHVNYGGKSSYLNIFIPTLNQNGWGAEMGKTFAVVVNDIGADGVFMDEPTFCRIKYAYNKTDGCSADIDQKTHKIIRKKGSMALLSKDWRYKYFKKLLDEKRPFMANGAPYTKTLTDLKFQAFTESGDINNCSKMVLHSPIALGDHLTERKYKDSYNTMLKALERGCLYAWYGHIFHMNKAPTFYMYPFTPIEIHEGYVIGRERIITGKSGYFGWGDKSGFNAYVFDSDGKPTDKIKIPEIMKNGKSYAEVRIPEDFMVILVRNKKEGNNNVH